MATLMVIGVVALDRPIWIDAPLRPGGRYRARSLESALAPRLGGGAANAGCALRLAGHAVHVVSSLADDEAGAAARSLAESAGLDLDLSRTRRGVSSTTLVLIDPSGERTILGLDGSVGTSPEVARPADRPGLVPQGLLVRSAWSGAADWAAVTTGPVILHWPCQGEAIPADIVVFSADDLPPFARDRPFAFFAARFGERLKWAVMTLGASGAVAQSASEIVAAPAPPAVPCDTTGAGDVFSAGLLDALTGGADMGRALGHACAWGARAVEIEGSAAVNAKPADFPAFGTP